MNPVNKIICGGAFLAVGLTSNLVTHFSVPFFSDDKGICFSVHEFQPVSYAADLIGSGLILSGFYGLCSKVVSSVKSALFGSSSLVKNDDGIVRRFFRSHSLSNEALAAVGSIVLVTRGAAPNLIVEVLGTAALAGGYFYLRGNQVHRIESKKIACNVSQESILHIDAKFPFELKRMTLPSLGAAFYVMHLSDDFIDSHYRFLQNLSTEQMKAYVYNDPGRNNPKLLNNLEGDDRDIFLKCPPSATDYCENFDAYGIFEKLQSAKVGIGSSSLTKNQETARKAILDASKIEQLNFAAIPCQAAVSDGDMVDTDAFKVNPHPEIVGLNKRSIFVCLTHIKDLVKVEDDQKRKNPNSLYHDSQYRRPIQTPNEYTSLRR